MKKLLLLYNLKLKCLFCFHRSKWLTDNIYTDIYCKLSKCIGQTPCSYKHYLVLSLFSCAIFYYIFLCILKCYQLLSYVYLLHFILYPCVRILDTLKVAYMF